MPAWRATHFLHARLLGARVALGVGRVLDAVVDGGVKPNHEDHEAARSLFWRAARSSSDSSSSIPAGAPRPSTSINETYPSIRRHTSDAARTSNVRGKLRASEHPGAALGVTRGECVAEVGGDEEGEVDVVGEVGEDEPRFERKAPSRDGLGGGAFARTRRSSETVTVCLRACVCGVCSMIRSVCEIVGGNNEMSQGLCPGWQRQM